MPGARDPNAGNCRATDASTVRRRELLRWSGVGVLGSVAGCAGDDSGPSPKTKPLNAHLILQPSGRIDFAIEKTTAVDAAIAEYGLSELLTVEGDVRRAEFDFEARWMDLVRPSSDQWENLKQVDGIDSGTVDTLQSAFEAQGTANAGLLDSETTYVTGEIHRDVSPPELTVERNGQAVFNQDATYDVPEISISAESVAATARLLLPSGLVYQSPPAGYTDTGAQWSATEDPAWYRFKGNAMQVSQDIGKPVSNSGKTYRFSPPTESDPRTVVPGFTHRPNPALGVLQFSAQHRALAAGVLGEYFPDKQQGLKFTGQQGENAMKLGSKALGFLAPTDEVSLGLYGLKLALMLVTVYATGGSAVAVFLVSLLGDAAMLAMSTLETSRFVRNNKLSTDFIADISGGVNPLESYYSGPDGGDLATHPKAGSLDGIRKASSFLADVGVMGLGTADADRADYQQYYEILGAVDENYRVFEKVAGIVVNYDRYGEDGSKVDKWASNARAVFKTQRRMVKREQALIRYSQRALDELNPEKITTTPTQCQFTNPVAWPQAFHGHRNTAHAQNNVGPKATTGKELKTCWETSVTSSQYPAVSGAILHNGTIYLRAGPDLVALDPSTGTERWRLRVGEPSDDGPYTPLAHDGLVYTSSGADRAVYVVDPRKQKIVHEATTQGSPSTLTHADGSLFVGCSEDFEGHQICALTPSLDHRWTASIDGVSDIAGAPAVANGRVFVHHESTLQAYDAETGDKLWKTDAGYAGSQPVASNGKVYAGGQDHLVEVSQSSGELQSEFTEYWVTGNLTLVNGTLFAGSEKGVSVFDTAPVTEQHVYDLDVGSHYPFQSPTVASGWKYLSNRNEVVAFDSTDNRSWTHRFDGTRIVGQPLATANHLLTVTADGTVHALHKK